VRAGAYDRFLRRRARYARRVVAATSVTLAVALALAVAVPRLLTNRDDVAVHPKGQVVSRPEFGYELVVPPGWRVAGAGYSGSGEYELLLRPETAAGFLPRVAVAPVDVDPRDYPGLPPTGHPPPGAPPGASPERLPDGPQLNGGPRPARLQGPFETGRRADGRAFIRSQKNPIFGSPGQTYYLIWPYLCPASVRCPRALRYRALRVTGSAQPGDGPGLQAVREPLQRIVDTVRPVTNALPDRAPADRPACQLSPPTGPTASASGVAGLVGSAKADPTPRVRVDTMVEGGPRALPTSS
jgi:hypothetical protein